MRFPQSPKVVYLYTMSEKKNIRDFDLVGLKEYFETIGDKRFRAMQAYEWLWKKNARSFDEMSNLSLDLRTKLKRTLSSPNCLIIFETPAVETVILFGLIFILSADVILSIDLRTFL